MKNLFRFFLLSVFILSQPSNVIGDTTKLNVGNDGKIDFSEYKGKVIYLDFWASWCEPCRQSFTWMNEMHDKYSTGKFVIIAVNLDTKRHLAQQFLQKKPAKFNIAYDPEGITAEAYNLKAMPSSYLIDKRGKLVASKLGFHASETDKMENSIRKLLGHTSLASR